MFDYEGRWSGESVDELGSLKACGVREWRGVITRSLNSNSLLPNTSLEPHHAG